MPSFFALLALCGVWLLAIFPDPRLLPPNALGTEKITLLFLAATFLLAFVPSLQRRLSENRDAATWALLTAFFILFHLAERAGPRDGWSLRFATLPDDAFAISYALRIVVLGAILSFPAWFRGGGPQKFVWVTLGLIGVLGWASFWFLGRFYKVGVTETLDPTPLPTLAMQIVGFGALAAICRAATASPTHTRLVLRLLPFALLLVWAKFQWMPAPLPAEDAE
jgi:hypothetical protein